MKIHHLNCATLCPLGWKWVDKNSSGMVCHCLLVETPTGLVLVDTGLGRQVVQQRQAAIGLMFHAATRPKYELRETAHAQICALGYAPKDVQHIILTHLDPDHAGGVRDFPNARVHVHALEFEEATSPRIDQKSRYQAALWSSVKNISTYDQAGEMWNDFQVVQPLDGLPPEILLVPLFGHSRGHCGVAIHGESGWLLHSGDAYFHRNEVAVSCHCPSPLRIHQASLAYDNAARLANRDRLRDLALDPEANTRVFCAHDAIEFQHLSHSAWTPNKPCTDP